MRDESARIDALERLVADLVAGVDARDARIASLEQAVIERDALVVSLQATVTERDATIAKLTERVAGLEAKAGQNSGNSGLPPSRDPAAERKRQAEERAKKRGGPKRKPGGQPGRKGTSLELSDTPNNVVDHRPAVCGCCGKTLPAGAGDGFQRRQVIDLPEITPMVTEHRAHAVVCGCGHRTQADFPDQVRGVVSYGPRVRAVVVYLMGRHHVPNAACAEAMADLFGIRISEGGVDRCLVDAGRRLLGFIAALIAVLRAAPVVHADETTDRVGTDTWWMHVVSTRLYTYLHAARTRGEQAIIDAGVLAGYTGVIVHDRLALYWRFKKAKHGLCSAHLLRDLANVAEVATQRAWATGLAGLLVEIDRACEQARLAGHRRLAPARLRAFTARYDDLVTQGRAANPEPAAGRKRDRLQRESHNLVVAFETHKPEILRFMSDLDVSASNNNAERALRPLKNHHKISGCFRSEAGAHRYAKIRSYLDTVRKNDVPALQALVDLFNGTPWMPPASA